MNPIFFKNLTVKRTVKMFLVLLLAMSFLTPTQAQILDNKGDDFIMAFLPNYDASGTIEVHLTSSVSTSVTVEYPVNSPTFVTTVPVSPGNVTIVSLPNNSPQGWAPNTIANNCVHAFAPDEFVCYMINRRSYTSDAALALPVDVMNTDYIVMDYNPRFVGAQFNIYAAFDNTTVTIIPTTDMVGHPADVPFTVTLNRGEGYFGRSSTTSVSNSLTGTIIEANLPVGLTNGNGCTQVPSGTVACDHIFEVAQPVQTWGNEVLATNLPNRSGSVYRVLASEDNTTVILDGASLPMLNRGDFHETGVIGGSHVFQGDKPICVAQFMVGIGYPGSTSGDPAQGNMIPSDQYLTGYTFSTVGGGQFVQNFVTIIAHNLDVGLLTLDGAPVPVGAFTPIAGTGFSSAIRALTSGTHTTASTHGHGITVEGYNQADSYIYPGGARFQFINPKGDANPPICQVNISGVTGTGSVTDNRPSEDTNGNDILDPGEDLNGNGQIDEDTGIFFVVLEPDSSNVNLTVDPFTPGDGVVNFMVTLINPGLPGLGTVTATDGAGNTCSTTMDLAPPLQITTDENIPNGTLSDEGGSTEYLHVLQATGGTPNPDGSYSWSVIDGYPGGLSLDPSSGEISGKVYASGVFLFKVRVSDSKGRIATKDLSLTVRNPRLEKPGYLIGRQPTEHFDVWFSNPAEVLLAIQIGSFLEKSYQSEVEIWGYKPGASKDDPSTPGYDESVRYQVWITLTGKNEWVPTEQNRKSTTPKTFSRIHLNSFLLLPGATDESDRLDICAHEYHHACQHAYVTSTPNEKQWIIEGSAAWMGYRVRREYTNITGNNSWQTFKKRIEHFQNDPWLGLTNTNRGTQDKYDACIWPYFLEDNTDTGQPVIMQEFWEELGSKEDPWSKVFEAFDTVLTEQHETSLNSKFNEFLRANYLPDKYYPTSFNPALSFRVNLDNNSYESQEQLPQGEDNRPDDMLIDINPFGAAYMKLVPDGQDRYVQVEFEGLNNLPEFTVQFLLVKDENPLPLLKDENYVPSSLKEMVLDSNQEGTIDCHIDGTQGETGVLIIGRVDQFDEARGKYEVTIRNLTPPDLSVLSIGTSPNSPVKADTSVQITASIQNQGETPANSDVSFYYDVQDAGHLIATNTVSVAGSNSTDTVANWDTTGLGDGTHPIIVAISNVMPAESDTTNNEATKDFEIDNTPPIISDATSSVGGDTDNSYVVGSTVRIHVSEQNNETGLIGAVTITTDGGDPVVTDAPLLTGSYYYDWNSQGRNAGEVFHIETTLQDAVGNKDSDGLPATPDLVINLHERITVDAPNLICSEGQTTAYSMDITNEGSAAVSVTDVQIQGGVSGSSFSLTSTLPLEIAGNSTATVDFSIDIPDGTGNSPPNVYPQTASATTSQNTQAESFFDVLVHSYNTAILDIHVVDDVTSASLANALVQLEGISGSWPTGGDGWVRDIVVPSGGRDAYVWREHYLPQAEPLRLSQGYNTVEVRLTPGEVLEVEDVTSTPLTPQEIEDRGVDLEDPENYWVYDFEVKLAVATVTIPSVTLPKNPIPGITYPLGGGGGGGGGYWVGGTVTYTPPQNPGDPSYPVYTFIIIPGEIKLLKEFFSVSTRIKNNAPEGSVFDIINTTATLMYPSDKLTLVDLFGVPQDITKDIGPGGTIAAGAEESVDWVLRGDVEGTHTIMVNANGTLMPFSINLESSNSGTVDVYGKPELEAVFIVDDPAWPQGGPYLVQEGHDFTLGIKLTNKSEIPVYYVSAELFPERFVNAELPAGEFAQKDFTPRDLEPGQTGFVSFQITSLITGFILPEFSSVAGDPLLNASLDIRNPIGALGGFTASPVDIDIIDPNGQMLGKTTDEIPDGKYAEVDFGDNGDVNDQFFIPDPVAGTYYIRVYPEADAQPGDTYSLNVWDGTQWASLAQDFPVPAQGDYDEYEWTPIAPEVVQTDVTSVSQIDKFGTRFDRATGQFLMMATWTNIGDEQCSEPLQMVIENITPDTVTCANEDGTTDDGKPYFDYSILVGDGNLAPGETSEAKQLAFNNPTRARFEFDVSCWAVVEGGAAPGIKPIGQAQRIHIVIPAISALAQNFPNPFNPDTWIPYELADANDVKISIYDLKGRLVRTIDLGNREIGQYFSKEEAAYWNGRNNIGENSASGIYFYQIQAGDFQAMRKMVIIK